MHSRILPFRFLDQYCLWSWTEDGRTVKQLNPTGAAFKCLYRWRWNWATTVCLLDVGQPQKEELVIPSLNATLWPPPTPQVLEAVRPEVQQGGPHPLHPAALRVGDAARAGAAHGAELRQAAHPAPQVSGKFSVGQWWKEGWDCLQAPAVHSLLLTTKHHESVLGAAGDPPG